MVLLAIGVWLLAGVVGGSHPSPASAAGLAYAQQHMVWSSGPDVQSVHVVRIADLPAAVRRYVPATIRRDLNLADARRRFGARREVALVVLHGSYNSLPPDEGLTIQGDVVELVDVHTNEVLLLTS